MRILLCRASIRSRTTYAGGLGTDGADSARAAVVQPDIGGAADIGAALEVAHIGDREVQRVRRGDRSHLPHWGVHVVAVGLLFWFISGVCGFPCGSMSCCRLSGHEPWPAAAFYEHRAAMESAERTASCESNFVFGMLFLYNNLHVVHHRMPAMPWYDIPRYYARTGRS